MRRPIFLAILALGACSSPGGPYPSLQPRAAEAIDPRLPVPEPTVMTRPSPALAKALVALVAEADKGDEAFQPLAKRASDLAGTAGPKESESWVVAQQALSAAVAARGPVARAVADIDALATTQIHAEGGISAGDRMAIDAAAERVAGIDSREAASIAETQARLAR